MHGGWAQGRRHLCKHNAQHLYQAKRKPRSQVGVGVREDCLRELLGSTCTKRCALQWRSQNVEFAFALKSRFCHRELLWFWKWQFLTFLNQWHRFNQGSRKQITTAPVGRSKTGWGFGVDWRVTRRGGEHFFQNKKFLPNRAGPGLHLGCSPSRRVTNQSTPNPCLQNINVNSDVRHGDANQDVNLFCKI